MTKKSRIELRVDDAFVRAIADIAERTHKSKAEVIRDALNLYSKAIYEWEYNQKGIVFQRIEDKELGSATINGASKICIA